MQPCVFCDIVAGRAPAAVVYDDEQTIAFVDLRQANPGHTLVVPRRHVPDVRDLDAATGAHLMATLIRITKAVGSAFPSDGISVWHSIGPAAFQEVPHLHIHVHPRTFDDGLLRVYPDTPEEPPRETLEEIARSIRRQLS